MIPTESDLRRYGRIARILLSVVAAFVLGIFAEWLWSVPTKPKEDPHGSPGESPNPGEKTGGATTKRAALDDTGTG
jgi:hypothetical protein